MILELPIIGLDTNNMGREYVSSLSNGFVSLQKKHALPTYIDDLTYALREDIYNYMSLDAQIAANTNLLKNGILGGGEETIPFSDDPLDIAIADFVRRNVNDYCVETPLVTEVYPDMLNAMATGNRIAEIVYETPDKSPSKGDWTLKRVKVKERKTVTFWVDQHNNILAIAGMVPEDIKNDVTQANVQQLYPGSIAMIGNFVLFDPNKFFWISWKPENNNPLGRSDYRAVYDPYYYKQQLKTEYMRYLTTYGIGSLWAELPPNSETKPMTNDDGSFVRDDKGEVVKVNPADELLQQMINFQNNSILVVPNGTTVNQIQSQSDGRPFITGFDFFNLEITKGLTGQISATENVNTGVKGADVGHQLVNLPIHYGCMVLSERVRRHIYTPLVRMKFGAKVNIPKCRFPGMNESDFLSAASAISKLLLANAPPELMPQFISKMKLDPLTQDQIVKWIGLYYNTMKPPAPPVSGNFG